MEEQPAGQKDMALEFESRFFAYLDPGTGSFAIQFVIAALAGSVFAIRRQIAHAFSRLKGLLSRREKK